MKPGRGGGVKGNAVLLLSDSIVRMGCTLFIGIAVARAYGPEGFGTINTAIALCTLVLGFSALGMSGILIKDLIEKPNLRGAIMATVVTAKVVMGLILYASLVIGVFVLGDQSTAAVVAVIGFGFVFASADVFEANFNADSDFRRLVFLHILGILISTASKVVALAMGVSIEWLAIGYALDYVLLYLFPALYFFFRVRPSATPPVAYAPKISGPLLKDILRRSWPIMISGFLAQVNLRIDALLIAGLVSISQVGVYTAAGRLSESWTVLAMAVVSAVFPKLVRSAGGDRSSYANGLQSLFRFLIWVSLSGAIVVYFASSWIIDTLYGDAFSLGATVLSIHIFGGMFLFIRTALSRWLIVEGLFIFSLVSHGAGALVNIIGNLLFLDRFGIVGAAWVAVLSYSVSGLLFLLLTARTRVLFAIIILSPFPGQKIRLRVRGLTERLPSAHIPQPRTQSVSNETREAD